MQASWPFHISHGGCIEWLVQQVQTHDAGTQFAEYYRHALEIALEIMQSAKSGHARVALPLADRSLRVKLHPHRYHGGDVAGWGLMGQEPSIAPSVE